MKCQFDAFADYVAEAEKRGTEKYPLYEWTKATIEDPAKKEKYLKSFTLYVDGNEVYAKEKADALESELQPLVGGTLVTRMSKHDTRAPRKISHSPIHASVVPDRLIRAGHDGADWVFRFRQAA